MRRGWNWFGGLSPAKQAVIVICLLVVLAVIIGAAASGGGGDKTSSPNADSPPPPPPPSATTTEAAPPPPPEPPPPSEPKKATNGDDAKDLRDRAQQAVNRAEVCLAALQIAGGDTSSAVAMASNLQDARKICEASKTYLATNNSHGFSDENTTLFASADEGKSATGAGLAYLDTQAPSKLADLRSHIQDAAAYFNQGFSDLNSRLNELGVARVKR
jgi:hypothetical protein